MNNRFSKIAEQIRERKVIQAVTIYAGTLWVILQVLEFFSNQFEWNSIGVKAATIIGISFFPSAIAYAWFRNNPNSWRKQILLYSINTIAVVFIIFYSDVLQENSHEKSKEIVWSKSIAVLPFANLSSEKDQEFFSDGMTDEMINALSKIPSLKVIGRSSSFSFKGKNHDLREIAKKLGVSNLLEGSVRKYRDKVKISVQLINPKDGSSLWSDAYERKGEDVLQIHDEVAAIVASKLRIALLQGLAKSPTVDKEAFDFYLKGREALSMRRMTDAEDFFNRSIALDSTFAPALAALAETYALFSFWGGGKSVEYFPKAEAVAQKASKIDTTLSTPSLVRAIVEFAFNRDPITGSKFFLAAQHKNPDYAPNHYIYAQFLISAFRFDEAYKEIAVAMQLEPMADLPYSIKGRTLLWDKKIDKAIEVLKTAIEMNSKNKSSYNSLGHCYLALGRLKEAELSYRLADDHNNKLAQPGLINCLIQEGKLEQAKNLFEQKMRGSFEDVVNRSKTEKVSFVSLANAASYLGKKDLAHQLLLKAFEEHDEQILILCDIPIRQPNDLLTDPRNVALIKKNKMFKLLEYYSIR
jgi:adenylate cyclase